MVEILAGNGYAQGVIAPLLGIDLKTLRKYYRQELDRGRAHFLVALVLNLHRLAQRSDGVGAKAVMFALQCRFGWSPWTPPA